MLDAGSTMRGESEVRAEHEVSLWQWMLVGASAEQELLEPRL